MLEFIRRLFRKRPRIIATGTKSGSYIESLRFTVGCHACKQIGETVVQMTPEFRGMRPIDDFVWNCPFCGAANFMKIGTALSRLTSTPSP